MDGLHIAVQRTFFVLFYLTPHILKSIQPIFTKLSGIISIHCVSYIFQSLKITLLSFSSCVKLIVFKRLSPEHINDLIIIYLNRIDVWLYIDNFCRRDCHKKILLRFHKNVTVLVNIFSTKCA